MSHTLAAPWKRLTLAAALSAASFVLAPAPQSEAKPITPLCPFGNSVITAWYSDPGLTQGWCQDITTPCPGYSATHYCDGSHTPYSKQICVACSLN